MLCRGGCKRLRERLQTFASEKGKTGIEISIPILDKRKDGSIRVTIAPRKYLLNHQYPTSAPVPGRHYITPSSKRSGAWKVITSPASHQHSGAWKAITSQVPTSALVPGGQSHHKYPQALWCLEGTTMSNRGQRPRI